MNKTNSKYSIMMLNQLTQLNYEVKTVKLNIKMLITNANTMLITSIYNVMEQGKPLTNYILAWQLDNPESNTHPFSNSWVKDIFYG